MNCAKCHAPLPVHTFAGATPERQAVFTWKDGVRVCADPCRPAPQPINPPSAETGD